MVQLPAGTTSTCEHQHLYLLVPGYKNILHGHSHFVLHCSCWKCTIVPVMQIVSAMTITLVHFCGNWRVTTLLMHLPFHQGEKRSHQAPQFQTWPSKSLWKDGEGCRKQTEDSQTEENAVHRVISGLDLFGSLGRGQGGDVIMENRWPWVFPPSLSSKERHHQKSLFEYRQWGLCWQRI